MTDHILSMNASKKVAGLDGVNGEGSTRTSLIHMHNVWHGCYAVSVEQQE